MIGEPLKALLAQQGHHLHTLVRREPRSPTEHQWDPHRGTIDSGIINTVDVVVNLAAASIGKIPWTKKHKALILSSRRETTRTLAAAIAASRTPPRAFVQGSAVGFYGERGTEELDERSTAGTGFLADVVIAWEDETSLASTPKTRVILGRTGLVVGKGGAMAPLMLQTSLGVAGPIGPGTQWWPWISLHDEIRALAFLVSHASASGIYNLVGPTPARANTLTRTLARAMRRPHWLGLPRVFISWLMGEGGESLLLTSQKIHSTELQNLGFSFDDGTIEEAIERLVES